MSIITEEASTRKRSSRNVSDEYFTHKYNQWTGTSTKIKQEIKPTKLGKVISENCQCVFPQWKALSCRQTVYLAIFGSPPLFLTRYLLVTSQ